MATACACMVVTSWLTIDSEMQQRWCAKNEECEPFIRPYAVVCGVNGARPSF